MASHELGVREIRTQDRGCTAWLNAVLLWRKAPPVASALRHLLAGSHVRHVCDAVTQSENTRIKSMDGATDAQRVTR